MFLRRAEIFLALLVGGIMAPILSILHIVGVITLQYGWSSVAILTIVAIWTWMLVVTGFVKRAWNTKEE